jgi:6-phosphogluconate dehydrogenase
LELGFVGLGKMGGAMAARLDAAGHSVIGFDENPAVAKGGHFTLAASLEGLVASLTAPRIIWVMTPPGNATENVITALKALLAAGDIVVDGGNSDFRDSRRRSTDLKARGITLIDVGVSGGTQGARTGCGLLVGAEAECFERLKPIFETLAAPNACRLVGGSGAGHFAKAVHNGVEYAIMQAYGEGFELLSASDIHVDVLATLEAYQGGCSIRSHILQKLLEALRPDPGLASIRGYVADSGMGRWTVEEAIRLRVPTPTISAALQARFRSQQDDSPTMKSIAALRGTIGGHAVRKSGDGHD